MEKFMRIFKILRKYLIFNRFVKTHFKVYKLGWKSQRVNLKDLQNEVGEGWSKLIAELVEDLENAYWDGHVIQIKEKFGLLRIYLGETNPTINKLIDEAELKSGTICELCGKLGNIRSGSWLKTLCDYHKKTF